jgi:hypothetical protein
MEKHNLIKELKHANAGLVKAVAEAAGILKKYHVTKAEIQKLILSKLQG